MLTFLDKFICVYVQYQKPEHLCGPHNTFHAEETTTMTDRRLRQHFASAATQKDPRPTVNEQPLGMLNELDANNGCATPAWRQSHVTKTMWPPQAGTLKFLRTHGQQLVCVRYRQDANGLCRSTTIELVVDSALVNSLKARGQWFEVPIAFEEVELRSQAKKLGAKWLPERRVWQLSGRAVQKLKLTARARRVQQT